MPSRRVQGFFLWLIATATPCLGGMLRLSSTLGSHMVLQRAPQAACLWGWAEPLADIHISLDNLLVAQGQAGTDGTWNVCMSPQEAGGPHTVQVVSRVPGGKALEEGLELSDVLFGEVWLCSGQSNMQFAVGQVFNATEEMAKAANYPDVRVFAVALNTSTVPLDDLSAPMLRWSAASPTSIGGPAWKYFSAACWFYGMNLSDKLGVPIGLVSSSYGSTQIKSWSSPDSIRHCSSPSPSETTRSATASARSKQQLRGSMPPEPPDYYRPALTNGFTPDASWCYNAMIHPLLPMALKGVVWSQGEQDIYDVREYECLFPAMIRDWRKKFVAANSLGDMPFGFTQLAGYNDQLMGVSDDGVQVGRMRIGQYSGLQEQGVFMVVAFDLNDDTSPYGPVHYRNKQDVGLRLSLAADYYVYGTANAALPFGPTARTVTSYLYGSDKVLRVLVAYEGAGQGLQYSGHNLFELSMTETSTQAIPARLLVIISRETVMLEFDLTAGDPTSRILRYAMRNNPCPSLERAYIGVSCGLYSSNGLPALPFVQRL